MSQMKVEYVRKAAKDQGVCSKCSRPITRGDAYKFMKAFRGPKVVRCEDCPTWSPSQRETNEWVASAYDGQEAAGVELDNVVWEGNGDDVVQSITSILSDCAVGAREAADGLREAKDALPENFQEGEQGQRLEELADAIEGWADELEAWEPDPDNPEGGDPESWVATLVEDARGVVDGLDL